MRVEIGNPTLPQPAENRYSKLLIPPAYFMVQMPNYIIVQYSNDNVGKAEKKILEASKYALQFPVEQVPIGIPLSRGS